MIKCRTNDVKKTNKKWEYDGNENVNVTMREIGVLKTKMRYRNTGELLGKEDM